MTQIQDLTARQIHDIRRRRLAAFVVLQDFGRVRLVSVAVWTMHGDWITVKHYDGERIGECQHIARVPIDTDVEFSP